MISTFNKAVIISCAQVDIARPPAGPAVLAGICEKNNLDYEFFDLNTFIHDLVGDLKWSQLYQSTSTYPNNDLTVLADMSIILDQFCLEIKKHFPDLILISVLSYWQNSWCEQLLIALKRHNISAVTVAGGNGISVPYDQNQSFGKFLCQSKKLLDYYVLGEGDIVIDKFLIGDRILGLNSTNAAHDSWALQIDDLDELPFPSYKKINNNRYVTHAHSGELSIIGSRGCVRKCSFCDVAAIWKKFRFRSAKNIAEEIEHHYNTTGQTKFFFTDSLVNGSLKTFKQMLEEIIKLQEQYPMLKNIRYSGQFIIRPKEQHPEYMFELMKKSGFGFLSIGVESGSDQVRYHMGKKFTTADVDYHMEMCNKYEIGNVLLLMIGYPTETKEDFLKTVDMVKRYQKYRINNTLIDISESQPLILLKNTPLYDQANALGIDLSNDYSHQLWTAKTNPDLTVKERFRRYIEFQRLLVILKFPRSSSIINQINEYLNNIEKLIANTNTR
jgi:radical SAM superfamily enzyme YgiQ (UPF0313 family)